MYFFKSKRLHYSGVRRDHALSSDTYRRDPMNNQGNKWIGRKAKEEKDDV